MLGLVRILKRMLAIMVLAGVFACQSTGPQPGTGIEVEHPYRINDFSLSNQYNETVVNGDLKGSLVLVYFGFTNCPDECPTTLSIWKKVYRMLGDDGGGVKFVMISVDPKYDSPEQLLPYMANFHPDFIGLTGSLEDIEDIATEFNVFFREFYPEALVGGDSDDDPEHDEDYLVAHTTLTFLLNKDGQIVLAFPYNTSAELIVADLERYLD